MDSDVKLAVIREVVSAIRAGEDKGYPDLETVLRRLWDLGPDRVVQTSTLREAADALREVGLKVQPSGSCHVAFVVSL